MSYGRPASTLAWASWAGAAAYTRPGAAAADAEFAEPAHVEARAAAAGPLATPAAAGAVAAVASVEMPASLLGTPAAVAHMAAFSHAANSRVLRTPVATAAAAPQAYVVAPAVLRAPTVTAQADDIIASVALGAIFGAVSVTANAQAAASAQAASPLTSPLVAAFTDYTEFVDHDQAVQYVADLITPGGTVRVPISSWQATLQTAAKCYVQAVVPACGEHVDDINDATELRIVRRGTLLGGLSIEQEMAAAAISHVQLARGSANYSATVSGYSDAIATDHAPDAIFDRTLTGIRSLFSSSGGYRARCAIDWLVSPSKRVWIDETTSFVVGYANFYVNAADAYMDIGEAA